VTVLMTMFATAYHRALAVHLPPRMTAYLAGLACLNAIAAIHASTILPGGVATFTLRGLLFVAFVCFYRACRGGAGRRESVGGRQGPVVLVLCVLTAGAIVWNITAIGKMPRDLADSTRYWNDAAAETDCATELLLAGHNPYASFDLIACFTRLHMNGRYTTPLRAGAFASSWHSPSLQARITLFARAKRQHIVHPTEFESTLSYPAGAFLVLAPFAAAGWHDVGTLNFCLLLAIYVVVGLRGPPRARLWIAPLVLSSSVLWTYGLRGFTEGPVLLLLVCWWMARDAGSRWRWVSILALGLAVSTRQEGWLYAPYDIVLAWQTIGRRTAIAHVAVLLGVFLVINGVFMLATFEAWRRGVGGPLLDPMFPGGDGLIGLGVGGVLGLWPRPLYTMLEGAALALCLWRYSRICRLHPDAALVLALVPLVFAWRSLSVYFLLPLPLLCLYPVWRQVASVRQKASVRAVQREQATATHERRQALEAMIT